MKTTQIRKKITEVPAGRFFRIRYISQCKLAADWVEEGYSLFKIVDTTTRTGVRYSAISDVETPSEHPEKSLYETVVPNRIKKLKSSGKEYVILAPVQKASHKREEYILVTPKHGAVIIKEDRARIYTVPSYWTKKPTKYVTVSLDNILMVR